MQDSVTGAEHARPLPSRLIAMKAKACHEAYSALQVELLLCYALAGSHVRCCMLSRDDPDSCTVLSSDHNIYPMSFYALLLCCIASLPYSKLNWQVMLCHWVVSRSSLPGQQSLS